MGSNRKHFQTFIILSLVFLFGVTACSIDSLDEDSTKLKVIATTSILADVVDVIGAEMIDLNILLPPGSDAHTFQPTPQDVAMLTRADVIFINSLGLEEFLDTLLEKAGGDAQVISVSEGIETITLEGGEIDPHVWLDPNNVIMWADNIAAALSRLDPINANQYSNNASAYQQELRELDAWIEEQVAKIHADRRILVSDHHVFGYFAKRYGFTFVGAIIPGYSTLAEPSARQLVALQDAILKTGAPAIFVGEAFNVNLAQRVAEDTRTSLIYVYTSSLSAADGPAGTYVEMMRFNVEAISRALR
jgi:ABC-type Zn uptake system ZnuABC Zn-binding protein ZnuA